MPAHAVISGIGRSAWARRLDDDAETLALTAVRAALDDAGLAASDVDAIYAYSGFEPVPLTRLTAELGVTRLRAYGEFPLGADAIPAAVQTAAALVATGEIRHAVLYRSIKKPPRPPAPPASAGAEAPPRPRSAPTHAPKPTPRPAPPAMSFLSPHGVVAPTVMFGLMADRYLTVTGTPVARFEDALAAIVIGQREAAAGTPHAILRDEPLTRAEYDASPLYADPLRRADLCLDHDGAAAIVVSAADAVDTRAGEPTARVLAAAAALRPGREPFAIGRDDLESLHHPAEIDPLFDRAGVTRARVRVAQLYDACSFMVLQQLEGFGFAPAQRAVDLVLDQGLGAASPLPVNTVGGNLAEAYVHGLNGFIEAVRQIRGTSARQVDDADVSFFGAPTGGAVILGR